MPSTNERSRRSVERQFFHSLHPQRVAYSPVADISGESLRELKRPLGVLLADLPQKLRSQLKSYIAARAEVMPNVEHLQQKYQNNRAENSHQPTRVREKVMRRFKSAGHAQRFLSVFGIITSHFRPGRHLFTRGVYKEVMKSRFVTWKEVIAVQAAA
jgi:hypothetical protein